jgi:hypothetical protein
VRIAAIIRVLLFLFDLVAVSVRFALLDFA